MPIQIPIKTRRLSQSEFGNISYCVMEHAFAFQKQFGRFFNEAIYKNGLAERVDGSRIEIPITVSHRTFSKQYFIDFFVGEGGIFELKCVEKIIPRHRAQLTNYLLMADLEHGKIINFRPPKIEHKFVNCTTRLAEQKSPRFEYHNWRTTDIEIERFEHLIDKLVSDWGVGLSSSLYTEAVIHFMGTTSSVDVNGLTRILGTHDVSLLSERIAFKITTMTKELDDFRIHAKRFLDQTWLDHLVWANMIIGEVRLELISRK